MTPTETVAVVAYIEAGCPSMRMSDNTPDVWFDAGLSDVPADIAKEAAANLIRTQRYVALSELLSESEAISDSRLAAIRHAELERDDPERFAIEAAPGRIWRNDEDPESGEAKRAARRQLMAEAFAKAKVGRETPKVDKRAEDTVRREARAQLAAAEVVPCDCGDCRAARTPGHANVTTTTTGGTA
jgi:hypothetical protein